MSESVDLYSHWTADDQLVFERLERTLEYARSRDYTGWDYGDGMDSRLLDALPVEHKWLNIVFQEAAKRSPINVRPLLMVRQRRNYQGASLFAMANQTMAELLAIDGPDTRLAVAYDREARSLADWLVENRITRYNGYCAGYPHPIQHLDGRGEPGEPDIINTSFGVKSLLRAAEYDPSYAETVRTAAEFVTEDLDFSAVDAGRGAVIQYHTKHEEEYYTINAGAMCARMFVDLYRHFGEDRFLKLARELLNHIVDLQTDLGGWMYRDPPEASHLSMDNHHNGFIIESFQRYRSVTGDTRYDDSLATALEFYRNELFESDGAPNFEDDSRFPRDIHASAQGVLVFTYANDHALARRIIQWALENLYAGDGAFYFKKERYFTKRVVLMRWCQAWMAYAMSEYLRSRVLDREPSMEVT